MGPFHCRAGGHPRAGLPPRGPAIQDRPGERGLRTRRAAHAGPALRPGACVADPRLRSELHLLRVAGLLGPPRGGAARGAWRGCRRACRRCWSAWRKNGSSRTSIARCSAAWSGSKAQASIASHSRKPPWGRARLAADISSTNRSCIKFGGSFGSKAPKNTRRSRGRMTAGRAAIFLRPPLPGPSSGPRASVKRSRPARRYSRPSADTV